MTDALPDRPAVGQRWRYDGKDRSRTWEVERVEARIRLAVLREVRAVDIVKGQKRGVDFERLLAKYVYLGDYSIPEGYSIHKISAHCGGHCYRDPFGHVEGPPPGERWTWKQARDAAVAAVEAREAACYRKG